MRILKFIVSWQFWVSLIVAVGIFFGLLQATFWWLGSYTNHGVQVEVPNLKNFTLEQAIKKLDDIKLEYEIDTSKYDPTFKPYQILDIYPLVGSNVKEGRRIFIRANAKTWKPVAIPNIIGKYKYLAFSQLDLVGLQVSDTIYEPNLAVNTVLKILYKGKEVQPGVTLPRFSSLTLVLAKGLAKNVIVPSFIGLDESTAKNMITENLFSVGSIIYDNPEDTVNARVYYQVPVPSSNYDQGQSVDLYLSSKPLEELKEKIKNLDATFNKKYINKQDSLSPSSTIIDNPNSTVIESPVNNNTQAKATQKTPSQSGATNSNKKEENKSNNKENSKPKRVIIE